MWEEHASKDSYWMQEVSKVLPTEIETSNAVVNSPLPCCEHSSTWQQHGKKCAPCPKPVRRLPGI